MSRLLLILIASFQTTLFAVACKSNYVSHIEDAVVIYSYKKICIDDNLCPYFQGNKKVILQGKEFDLLDSEIELVLSARELHGKCESGDLIYTCQCFNDTILPLFLRKTSHIGGNIYKKNDNNDMLYIIFRFTGNILKVRNLDDIKVYYLNRNLEKCVDNPALMANPFYTICSIENCSATDDEWLKKHDFTLAKIDSFSTMLCH